MNMEHYQKILKVMAGGIACMLWVVSAFFSNLGFNISVPEMSWVGILLAISITVIEMVWNHEGFYHNWTIAIGGLAAYTYGIWSNVIGIMGAQGIMTLDGVLNDPIKLLLPVCLGVFLEITPEPLLLWAIVGRNNEDLLSHVLGRGERVMGQPFAKAGGQQQMPRGMPVMTPMRPGQGQGRQPFGKPSERPMVNADVAEDNPDVHYLRPH
jgi:hypothetical protein